MCYFFSFHCGVVFMRGRNKCTSNSNVSIKTMCILCAGCCFSLAVLWLQPSAGCMCVKRACAQIFWEDLGEENKLQQRGGGRDGHLCRSSCSVSTLFKTQHFSLHLPKIPQSILHYVMGKEKRTTPKLLIMALLCFPLFIHPPRSRYWPY